MRKIYAAKFKIDGEIIKRKYSTWEECKSQVTGVPGVLYKSFESEEARDKWLDSNTAIAVDDGRGIRAYLDGSYSRIKRMASWAFVVVDDNDQILHEEAGIVPGPSLANNIDGECYAAMHAIMWLAAENIKAKIVHDYVGIAAWLTGEFRAESESAKRYVARCMPYAENLEFVKVKGHTGNRWNEYVDRKAKEANI